MISNRKRDKLARAFLDGNEKKANKIAERERRRQKREVARMKRSRDSMGKGSDGCAITALAAGMAIAGAVARLRGWS